MKRELGDIMWYLIQACIALDVSPEEIIEMNVEKLKSRYPVENLMYTIPKTVNKEIYDW